MELDAALNMFHGAFLVCEISSVWRLVWHIFAGVEICKKGILISSTPRAEFHRGRRKMHQVKPWRGAFVSWLHKAWVRLQKYGFNRVLIKQIQGDAAAHGKKQQQLLLSAGQDFYFFHKCKNLCYFQNVLLNNVTVCIGTDRLVSPWGSSNR